MALAQRGRSGSWRLLGDIGLGRHGHVLCPFNRCVLAPGLPIRVYPALANADGKALSRLALSLDADLRDLPFPLLDEREQVAVDDVGVRGGEAVREARIVDLHRPLDQLC